MTSPRRFHAAWFSLGCRLLVLAGAAAGCATASETKTSTYGDNARRAYVEALEAFYDDDCFEAEPLMRNVRREYPYSRFAALADLRVADCNFKDDKHPEAIEAYNQFVRYRPSHPEVPYARFMAASATFEQIPSEWLLSPPAYERDQHFAQESLRLLRRFALDFPSDPLLPRAQQMAVAALRLLAGHEFYVATFYFDRDHPRAAAGRLNTLLRSYPGSGYEPEALYLLGRSYAQMDDAKNARRAFEELLSRYPDSELSAQAKDDIAEL